MLMAMAKTIRLGGTLLLLLMIAVACRDGSSNSESRVVTTIEWVQWTDSTRLVEDDSTLVAELGGLAIGSEGALFVSDVATGQVLAFSPSGELTQRIGRRGRGPGEMLAPAVLELTAEGDLLVLDNPTGRISRFRLSDGEYQSAVRLIGPTADIRYAGTDLWMTTAQVATNTSLARLSAGTDTLIATGRLPVEYTTYPRLLRAMALGALDLRGDHLWVGMQGTNAVERYAANAATSPVATVEIPRVRRRGVPLDDPTALKAEVSYEDEVASTSLLVALGALDDGRVATMHLDATIAESGLSVVAYLSVMNPETGAVCVDMRVPIEGSAVPVFRFEGNWLHLAEAMAESDGSSQTWVRRLDVSTIKCTG
jgi:hypothetical protein